MGKFHKDVKMLNGTTVLQTHNYNLFELNVGNRQLNRPNTRRIIKEGCALELAPIFVEFHPNKECIFHVVDGHHRFTAAEETRKIISFVVIPSGRRGDSLKYEINLKKWDLADVLRKHSENGIPLCGDVVNLTDRNGLKTPNVVANGILNLGLETSTKESKMQRRLTKDEIHLVSATLEFCKYLKEENVVTCSPKDTRLLKCIARLLQIETVSISNAKKSLKGYYSRGRILNTHTIDDIIEGITKALESRSSTKESVTISRLEAVVKPKGKGSRSFQGGRKVRASK